MDEPWCREHNKPRDRERLLCVDMFPRLAKVFGDGGLVESVVLICEECP